MANKSSLIIETLDHVTQNSQQKTITDLNPSASDAHLKTFAQMTVGLSKDSYVKADRVDRRNLDFSSRGQRNPQINVASIALDSSYYVRFSYSRTSWNASKSCFGIGISFSNGLTNNQFPSVGPSIVNLSSSVEGVDCTFVSYSWVNDNQNRWYFQAGPVAASQDDKQDMTLTFQIQIPAGDGYESYLSPVITVDLYDDTQEGGEG